MKRDPILTHPEDGYTLLCIRRINLDVCGSRAPRTVKANLSRIIRDYQSAEFAFGLTNYLPKLGWPVVEDRVGMAIALVTVNASLRPGKYAHHLQYDTMRKTPTWYIEMLIQQDLVTMLTRYMPKMRRGYMQLRAPRRVNGLYDSS
jgi:hypothetical protein